MKEIFERRSIRTFQDATVEKEKVERLLRAAMQAPSAMNQQPWEFLVIDEKESLQKLSLCMPDAKPVASSTLTIVLTANGNFFRYEPDWKSDMSAAAQNILLEAVYLGLGAVWMSVSAEESAVNHIRELYDLPSHTIPFALIAVGYPDKQKNRFIDRFHEERVHYGKW